jgi:hypothetical protein
MTELTNTPERQSRDPMDSDSDTGDIRPNPKRHRTRRRRWYLFAVILAVILTLAVGLFSKHMCTAIGAYSGISFDLNPVLAHASSPVHVRACIPSSCASFTVEHWGSGGFAVCDAPKCPPLPAPNGASAIEFIQQRQRDWEMQGILVVQVKDPALAWIPVVVRLTVEDQEGNAIFDSSAWVRPDMYQPNGPNCDTTVYTEEVVATRTGRLVLQT